MEEAVDPENMGVAFVVEGRTFYGSSAPLEIEAETVPGGRHSKQAWSIMVPSAKLSTKDFPKGKILVDTRQRSFKVERCSETRVGLHIFVIDKNR